MAGLNGTIFLLELLYLCPEMFGVQELFWFSLAYAN